MNPLPFHANALTSLAVSVSETEKPVPLSPVWFCVFICFHPVHWVFLLIFMCQFSLVGNIWPSTSICFLSCSKTERPPSLSLFPGGDGMVRGGLGGARMVSSDVWHSSDLSRPVYAPGYQVWQIWLHRSARGGVMITIILSDTPPLSLLVSRSGSWVVVRWSPAGLQGSIILAVRPLPCSLMF